MDEDLEKTVHAARCTGCHEDDRSPSEGVVLGIIMGAPLWALLFLLIWAFLHFTRN